MIRNHSRIRNHSEMDIPSVKYDVVAFESYCCSCKAITNFKFLIEALIFRVYSI